MCPNRTPRQLTTRRQKVAVTNMLGNTAMTGTLRARALPGNGLARHSRKRRNPAGQAADPVDQMHAGSTHGTPSWRPCWARQSWQEGRAFLAGLRGIEMALLGTISFYPTSSNRIVGPAARRAPRAGEAVVNVLADTQHATRRGAARHAARERGTVRSPVDTRPTERPAGCPICRDFLGFRASG